MSAKLARNGRVIFMADSLPPFLRSELDSAEQPSQPITPITPVITDASEARRQKLQTLLESILGNRNVYFQPPSGFKMKYPCIRYSLDRFAEHHADDILYHKRMGFEVIYIDTKPMMVVPDKIHALPLCRFVRKYVADNLNHYAYLLYF